jgi:DNA repair protein RadC
MEKPHYLRHRERLRERFLKTGFEGFREYEALELMLTWAIPRRDVKPIAKELIGKFGSLKAVVDATPEELTTVRGVKERTAAFIRSLKELIVLYQRSRLREGRRVSSTGELLEYLDSAMSGLKDEQFRAVFLNSKNEIIADEVIHHGTVNQSAVYPRKVMERALHNNATALIFVHNHPGGQCRPSPQDIKLTKELVRVAQGLQILVHDHLIICKGGYFSFLERGML